QRLGQAGLIELFRARILEQDARQELGVAFEAPREFCQQVAHVRFLRLSHTLIRSLKRLTSASCSAAGRSARPRQAANAGVFRSPLSTRSSACCSGADRVVRNSSTSCSRRWVSSCRQSSSSGPWSLPS